jgi:hypothetical protein
LYLNFQRNSGYVAIKEFYSTCNPLVQDEIRGESYNYYSNKTDGQIILPGQVSVSYPKDSSDNYGQFDKDVEIALKGELLYRGPYASGSQSEIDGNYLSRFKYF